MNNVKNNDKIAFCITCMNRLSHLEQTLVKNIQDNYLKDRVEFILLDYNSQDGLEEWVHNNLQKYIEEKMLVYYKTNEPTHYMRSHSRNMAFRLANATILCNLDADNFLGKGFANFILDEFSKNEMIFYSNNCTSRDAFGRISIRNNDFISIRGYNEALQGYGYEDGDIQNRLMLKGLKPISVNNPEFYHCISHTFNERISEESMAKCLYKMYITYINPYTSSILLLNKDNSLEQYTLIDKKQLNLLVELSTFDCFYDDRVRTVLQGTVKKGTWNMYNDIVNIQNNGNKFQIQKKSTTFEFENSFYYEIQDKELRAKIIVMLSDAINYKEAIMQIKNKFLINPYGFGRGVVYKNFNSSQKIILS